MPSRPQLLCFVALTALATSCSSDDPRRAQAEDALQRADAVIAEGRELADPYLDDASQLARSWMPDLPSTGELSDQGAEWIASAARDDARVEHWLARGEQTLPVARELGRALNRAIDRDFVVEPIYRPVADGVDLAAVDASIAAMPRVEVIDGLTVGFRKLMSDDVEGREKERAFLVMWRVDRTLVGFIFRSRRKIRLDRVVEDAPRLIEVVQATMK